MDELGLVGVEDAAAQAGISARTLRRWIASGRVDSYRSGRDRRRRWIRQKDLDRLLEPVAVPRFPAFSSDNEGENGGNDRKC